MYRQHCTKINKNPDLRATHSVYKQIAEGVAAEINWKYKSTKRRDPKHSTKQFNTTWLRQNSNKANKSNTNDSNGRVDNPPPPSQKATAIITQTAAM